MQQADWIPDWFPRSRSPRPPNTPDPEIIPGIPLDLFETQDDTRLGGSKTIVQTLTPNKSDSSGEPDGDVIIRHPEKVVVEKAPLDRTMITINGTLGSGLYWRCGQILELGGPLAVLLSFLLVGLLAFGVMQCITEMLCIWPIPGALPVYVSEFVDEELGIAVGLAYWYTYSVSFAALVVTTAAETEFWTNNKSLQGTVIFFVLPVIMVIINATNIEVYGFLEVMFGALKITFFVVIMIAMVVINTGVAYQETDWADPTPSDSKAADHWIEAFFISLSIAAFAYVGVEIVAACALEVRWPKTEDQRASTDLSHRSQSETLIGRTIKFSSIYIPLLATIAYTIGGLLASFNIQWNDSQLPRLSWTQDNDNPEMTGTNTTQSAFVAIAKDISAPLANCINAFLIFTALTCASTNLYVASRSLFALTSRLDGGPGQPWYLRVFAYFGKTNGRKVPMRAMVLSALAFCWIPFLHLVDSTGIGKFVEVLTEMGSVGVIIVWACECWAFIRFYHCIYRHQKVLKAQKISQVRRWDEDEPNDYPYRSSLQPVTAYASLMGCLFILVVSNGTSQWIGWKPESFLSSYMAVICFIGLWIILKLVRRSKWKLVDLSNSDKVIIKIRNLHEARFRGVDEKPDPPSLWNLYGLL
ncbi:amino acid permease-domain-containing protein [Apiospora kogelbergensis]|uniref:Amino acid permease-domain-containing protein n=1 Tax=Apiospora kogelbergensis TaxID=1337665 RepID=A0AAW0QXN0_9PEZI